MWQQFMSGVVPWSNVNDTEAKAQTFQYWSLLSEQKQNILFWSSYYRNKIKTFYFGPLIGTKAKHFDLVQNIFYCQQIVSVLAQKFWDKAKTIWLGPELYYAKCINNLIQKLLERSKMFWFGSKIFCIKSRSLPFWPKNSGTKQNYLICSGNCLWKSERI